MVEENISGKVVNRPTASMVSCRRTKDAAGNTTGDALLANTAAALAREHRRVARDEIQEINRQLQEVI